MQNKRKNFLTTSMLSGLVALNLGLVGCSKGQTAEHFISEAKAYQQKGDVKAAIIQLKNAVQKNPEDAQARYLLGTLYNETGDPQSAEKELRKALSLGMSAETVTLGFGTSLYALGQYKKVLEETEAVAAKNPDAEILTLRGNAYLALGRHAEAKESYGRALKQKTEFADALIGMARHALTQKDLDLAMRYAQQAVTSNAKYAPAWFFKGDLYAAQGKVEEALSSYDEVLKIKAGDARAHIARASLEIGARKFDAAKADIDAAKKVAPGELNVVFHQASLDFHMGKPAVAWESLQQVLRVAPDHMPSVMLAGAIQHALGASQQAEQYLRKVLATNPSNAYASRLLVSTLLKNGETDRAIAAMAVALKEAPQDPQLLALAGETYMKAKDYRKATEYFEKASAIAPQASMIRTALGVSRLAQGDNSRAVADLEISADLNPKTSQAGVLLVMNHLQKKEYDKALAAANKLEKAQPDNPVVHNLKGGVYAAKREWGQARASLEKAVALQANYFPPVGNLAQLDIQEKKPDAAKKRLEAFLQVDKKSVPAMTALARLAANQGRKEEVTSWLERASNDNPDQIPPALELGQHYLRTGDKSKAITLTQKLQTAHPNNPDVLDVLAQSQLANEDRTGALQSYNKIASLLPDSAVPHFRIATIHLRMQDEASAVNSLKKALALKPDYLDAQLALASIQARKGDYEQGLAVARQMQKQTATSAFGYELEGDMLMAQKKNDAALKAYDQAFARDKRAPMLIKLNEALKQSGKQAEANARLVKWIKENPKDTLVRMHLGTASLLKKENKAAIEQFQAVLQQDPKNVPAMNNIALAYQQEKDPRALEYAEKAYELAKENPAILDTLGWMLVEQGNVARGLPLLQKAASSANAALDTRYHLAAALAKSGDSAAAKKELNQLLDSKKTFAKLDEAKALQKQLQ